MHDSTAVKVRSLGGRGGNGDKTDDRKIKTPCIW